MHPHTGKYIQPTKCASFSQLNKTWENLLFLIPYSRKFYVRWDKKPYRWEVAVWFMSVRVFPEYSEPISNTCNLVERVSVILWIAKTATMNQVFNIDLDSFAIFRIIFWALSIPCFVVFSCLFFLFRHRFSCLLLASFTFRYIIKRRFPALVHFFNIFFFIQFTQTVFPYFPVDCYSTV